MDPDHPGDFLAIALRLVHGNRELLDSRADSSQQRVSRLSQRNASSRAVEQTYTQPLLQTSNRLAECRGGNSERFCSTAEAARVSDEHECAQLPKVCTGKKVVHSALPSHS